MLKNISNINDIAFSSQQGGGVLQCSMERVEFAPALHQGEFNLDGAGGARRRLLGQVDHLVAGVQAERELRCLRRRAHLVELRLRVQCRVQDEKEWVRRQTHSVTKTRWR